MPTITAQQILDENGWTTDSISLTNLEYLIDNIINYINAYAGTTISNLSGTAGSKTMTSTAAQDYVIKAGTALLVRAYLEKGPNVNIAALGVTQISTDPHYKIESMFFRDGLKRLIGSGFERV